jgi:bifunctional non-homologous end joining protein LigD
MGIVEIHTWTSTVDNLERPNRIVWDLDPGPDVSWAAITSAARLQREMLETLELRACVKTTGGRGLHVVVPLRPSLDVSQCLRGTNTSICAYSPRVTAGAAVSMPITWDELRHEPGRWTLRTAARRRRHGQRDPWADYWTSPQRLAESSIKATEAAFGS